MRIAVASGKGGTGKTLIATSLALAISQSEPVAFLDADVEAPNAHFFLKPEFFENTPVTSFAPRIQTEQCNGCGECVEFCAYSALAMVKKKILFFPELCHGCEGCRIVCPKAAIEKDQSMKGSIERGRAQSGIDFRRGVLTIGEPRSPVVINALKKGLSQNPNQVVIIDCPPGTGCSLMAAVESADYCLLVTEPTPFGFSDLKMAVAALEELHIPFGVIINKQGLNGNKTEVYCREKGIEVLGRIPYQRSIGERYARGLTLIDGDESFADELRAVFDRIKIKGEKS